MSEETRRLIEEEAEKVVGGGIINTSELLDLIRKSADLGADSLDVVDVLHSINPEVDAFFGLNRPRNYWP